MKFKRAFATILVGLAALTAFGCSSSDTSGNNAQVGMPNPMVEVSGIQDINDQLGIELDDSFLPSDAKYFIYSGEMAEIQFSEINVNNEEISVRFRARKNTDEDISGMYYDNFKEEEIPYGDLNIKHRYLEDNTINVYDIKNGDTSYCVTIDGNSSQMQLGAIMDKALVTFGIDSTFS